MSIQHLRLCFVQKEIKKSSLCTIDYFKNIGRLLKMGHPGLYLVLFKKNKNCRLEWDSSSEHLTGPTPHKLSKLHSTYHRPQVSSIYFMRFLCFDTRGLCFQSKHCHFLHEPGMTHYKNYIIIPPYKVLVDNLINILRE